MPVVVIRERQDEPRDWLLVSEMFTSHQGEGPSAGRKATFLRLGGCNLACEWCDTPYTWVFTERQQERHREHRIYDPKREFRPRKIGDLAVSVGQSSARLVVITGGEPLLQQEQLSQLISRINEEAFDVLFEIETAGTIAPRQLRWCDNVDYNVSLKLGSSGNPLAKRRVPEAIEMLCGEGASFKFVVTRDNLDADIAEIHEITHEYGISPRNVWLMPEGITQLDQVSGAQLIMPRALKLGYNFSTRLHVLAYGNERGK